jgi:hypothetical protein
MTRLIHDVCEICTTFSCRRDVPSPQRVRPKGRGIKPCGFRIDFDDVAYSPCREMRCRGQVGHTGRGGKFPHPQRLPKSVQVGHPPRDPKAAQLAHPSLAPSGKTAGYYRVTRPTSWPSLRTSSHTGCSSPVTRATTREDRNQTSASWMASASDCAHKMCVAAAFCTTG